jgi:hypothetical protein
MKIVEPIGEKQAHVFVPPSQSAHIPGNSIQLTLQGLVRPVVGSGGQIIHDSHSSQQLIAVFPCDGYGVGQ